MNRSMDCPHCQAQDPATARFCQAVVWPHQWTRRPCEIWFYDREPVAETHTVSVMPHAPMPRRPYHLDPHPQFSPEDGWVAYTTSVRGLIEVAMAPLEGILSRMQASYRSLEGRTH